MSTTPDTGRGLDPQNPGQIAETTVPGSPGTNPGTNPDQIGALLDRVEAHVATLAAENDRLALDVAAREVEAARLEAEVAALRAQADAEERDLLLLKEYVAALKHAVVMGVTEGEA